MVWCVYFLLYRILPKKQEEKNPAALTGPGRAWYNKTLEEVRHEGAQKARGL